MIYLLLKIFGCLLIVLSCFTAGYALSGRLAKRRNFLKNFLSFLNSLSTNIRYNSSEIAALINSSANSAGLSALCIDSDSELSPIEYWNQNIATLSKSVPINHSDKELLIEFGSQLGRTDLQGQLNHIELYQSLFETQLTEAEESIVQKSKLYKAMGFFVGASAVLILI